MKAPILVPVAKLLVAFPLSYHTLAGIRHVIWDTTADGLELEQVNQSSQYLFAAAAIISLLLAMWTLKPNKKRVRKLESRAERSKKK